MRPMSLRWLYVLMNPVFLILFAVYYAGKYVTIAVGYVLIIATRLVTWPMRSAYRRYRRKLMLYRLERRYGS